MIAIGNGIIPFDRLAFGGLREFLAVPLAYGDSAHAFQLVLGLLGISFLRLRQLLDRLRWPFAQARRVHVNDVFGNFLCSCTRIQFGGLHLPELQGRS